MMELPLDVQKVFEQAHVAFQRNPIIILGKLLQAYKEGSIDQEEYDGVITHFQSAKTEPWFSERYANAIASCEKEFQEIKQQKDSARLAMPQFNIPID